MRWNTNWSWRELRDDLGFGEVGVLDDSFLSDLLVDDLLVLR